MSGRRARQSPPHLSLSPERFDIYIGRLMTASTATGRGARWELGSGTVGAGKRRPARRSGAVCRPRAHLDSFCLPWCVLRVARRLVPRRERRVDERRGAQERAIPRGTRPFREAQGGAGQSGAWARLLRTHVNPRPQEVRCRGPRRARAHARARRRGEELGTTSSRSHRPRY